MSFAIPKIEGWYNVIGSQKDAATKYNYTRWEDFVVKNTPSNVDTSRCCVIGCTNRRDVGAHVTQHKHVIDQRNYSDDKIGMLTYIVPMCYEHNSSEEKMTFKPIGGSATTMYPQHPNFGAGTMAKHRKNPLI